MGKILVSLEIKIQRKSLYNALGSKKIRAWGGLYPLNLIWIHEILENGIFEKIRREAAKNFIRLQKQKNNNV